MKGTYVENINASYLDYLKANNLDELPEEKANEIANNFAIKMEKEDDPDAVRAFFQITSDEDMEKIKDKKYTVVAKLRDNNKEKHVLAIKLTLTLEE